MNTHTFLGLTICGIWLGSAGATPADISADSTPLGLILLLLGVVALLLGMRNLHDLRNKRMSPPRIQPSPSRPVFESTPEQAIGTRKA